MEIEIASADARGRIFKAQVKGHAGVPWTRDHDYLQPVSTSTLNYWRALPVPVVVFVVDLATRRTYWEWGKVAPEATGVRVRRAHSVTESADALATRVIDWLEQRGTRALRYGLPFFAATWDRVLEHIGYDLFMEMELENVALLEFAYRQTRLMRDAFSLSTEMLPWDVWIARSRVLFGDDISGMCCGIHDEVVGYLRPLVAELFELGKAQLELEEENSENAAAKSWASPESNLYRVETDFDDAPKAFWAEVDAHLARRGVLRYPTAKSAKFSDD